METYKHNTIKYDDTDGGHYSKCHTYSNRRMHSPSCKKCQFFVSKSFGNNHPYDGYVECKLPRPIKKNM